MSHFTVMVIGDPEEVLAPYHEYECTGDDNQYIQDIDITKSFEREVECSPGKTPLQVLEDSYGYPAVAEDQPNLDIKPKWGYAIVDADGNVKKVIQRTNPNSKWDWWTVGGRWDRGLTTHDGEKCNSALKKDIDLEAMLNSGLDKMLDTYDQLHPIVEEHGFVTFEQAKEKFPDDIDQARKFYHNGTAKALMTAKLEEMNPGDRWVSFAFPFERMALDREEFIKETRASNFTFAFADSNGWAENGGMGWFGMVTNEKESADWAEEWMKRWDQADDNDVVSIVDCHI